MTRVGVRGIYTTALTRLLVSAGVEVVDASDPIRRRFDREFPDGPADVTVESTGDRLGVGVAGDPDGVGTVVDHLVDVGIDAIPVADPTPAGAVFRADVVEGVGGGAILDLGGRDGYLPYDAVDDYVETGDRFRVQVQDPRPPWDEGRPGLGTDLRVSAGVATLSRGESGVSAATSDRARVTELARATDLLSASPPGGWGIRWEYGATDADTATLEASLSAAADRARALEEELDDEAEGDGGGTPRRLAAPADGRWVWFGRDSRFGLDDHRREVTDTMVGHHRIKAGGDTAGTAVDFVEAVGGGGSEFPFDAVTRTFGPEVGDRVRIEHGKPDGRLISLGRADVIDRDPDGQLRLERTISSSGEYDALGTPREPGDTAVTRVREGRWWYPTVYRGEDGERKGTYVNVCTPLEAFPGAVRYVDLYVDVVEYPDGRVERVDDDELDAAEREGTVPAALAARAREVAETVETALS